MNIDMHFHSQKSDGELHNQDLVKKAKDNLGELLICTDHDIVNEEIVPLLQQEGISSYEGVEISTSYMNNNKIRYMHMTSYQKKINKDIKDRLAKTLEGKKEKILRQIELLHKNGFDIETKAFFEKCKDLGYSTNNINILHIAQYIFSNPDNKGLLQKLLGENYTLANFIERCLKSRGDLHHIGSVTVKEYEPNIQETIALLQDEILSVAHPGYTFDSIPDYTKFVETYANKGINAVEINATGSKDRTAATLQLAKEHNLLLTFGSDFHNSKPSAKHGDLLDQNQFLSKEEKEVYIKKLINYLEK